MVCCEGNAGFYEIGATSAPIEAGYSVLGWNHPGFAGSSVRAARLGGERAIGCSRPLQMMIRCC